MNYQEILLSAKLLSTSGQARLISELLGKSQHDCLSFRRQQFYDRQTVCPRCGSERKSYYKYGMDKGCQRFKCNDCKGTFTEYTGTWLDGLHKKSRVVEYIELMIQGQSLDRISAKMGINKKTAFDWRHKILSSLGQDRGNEMEGIVESDETFFEDSEKGNRVLKLKRAGRQRGLSASEVKKRGVSDSRVAVIASAGRGSGMSLCVAATGRICKEDISCSIAGKLPENTVLCTDGHLSYKGFAMDSRLKHAVLRADLNQHVKKGVYHIQNVSSIHHRLKKWIDNTFWGVSTKYMQNYPGWFRLNEKLKGAASLVQDFFAQTMQDTDTLKRYRYIGVNYQWLLQRNI
jgi:transposase-like protein